MNIDNLSVTIDLDKVLDVTRIEPRQKHPTIFKYFDQLQPGDYFILHNDHDPKPLYYQLLGERGNIFSFEYLSRGPEDWFIQIQKTPVQSSSPKPGEQATANKKEQKTPAFPESIAIKDKNAADQSNTSLLKDDIILQYDSWDPDFLCAFIEQTDHRYFRAQAPELDGLGETIRLKHQKTHPELASLKMYQDQLFATLLFHLTQEKSALFDQVQSVQQAAQQNKEPDMVSLKQLFTGTTLKKQANETLTKLIEQIRRHTQQYQAPEDACDSYVYYFKRLSQFDLRLSRYLYLENTVLLPKISQWL
ncbi:hypothetical protein GCM10027566_28910 [Arachidicoccus ginsenosidivorans]|uniref:DUF2249 domain-containing protein n=1 Tax=Arachidicoccus ginsenosidivorans TaxID=496057 RepID=A0A5B8VRI0_9BACT|nr:DUF2249 domain-containing protein [Arachidicoccus ginsenosidivorans]QEC72888.1 DUF2249 domain-containing protein [Arachidicoccus ginsenosidivorans]